MKGGEIMAHGVCPVYVSTGVPVSDYQELSQYGEFGRVNSGNFVTKNVFYTNTSNVIYVKISASDSYFAGLLGIESNRTPLILGAFMANTYFELNRIRKEGTSNFAYDVFPSNPGIIIDGANYYIFGAQSSPVTAEFNSWSAIETGLYNVIEYPTIQSAISDNGILPISTMYPITYHYTNSTISGPSSAAVGDTVTVSAVPDTDYGITDASTQILITNNDIAVPYTWDAANQHITFTMPDPS